MNSPHSPVPLCLAITELETGGAERCLVNLACELDPEQFSVHVLSLAPLPVAPKDSLIEQLKARRISVDSLHVTSARQVLTAKNKLRHFLQKQQIQLLQTFLYHANVLGALAKGKKCSFIQVSGIRVADPSRWRQRVERWASRRWQHATCVSRGVATFCMDRLNLSENQLTVIPNGVDAGRFSNILPAEPNQLPLPQQRRILLTIGRLERQKGIDWLLKLAPSLLEQCPQHDLVFVGDGTGRSTLEQQVSRAGITSRVHFLGWRSDIPALLSSADLLLLPSRWEGMPNVLLEAMASSLPVVTRPVQGADDILGDEDNLQLVRSDSPEDFTRCVVQLVADPLAREEQGRSNRERVLNHFTLGRMIERYSALYTRLLSSPEP